MREPLKIVINPILRDERTERRIQEMYREKITYIMILVGASLLIFALL